jgi:hypothetical protein
VGRRGYLNPLNPNKTALAHPYSIIYSGARLTNFVVSRIPSSSGPFPCGVNYANRKERKGAGPACTGKRPPKIG